VELLAPRPTPNLEDQVSVFITSRDRGAQLYPQALGTHFGRLLTTRMSYGGAILFPDHHTGKYNYIGF
jgi:hypothetical protein